MVVQGATVSVLPGLRTEFPSLSNILIGPKAILLLKGNFAYLCSDQFYTNFIVALPRGNFFFLYT